ncbi:MAG: hypothetical protein OD918_03970 [Gammaproteobacteria bacterium]
MKTTNRKRRHVSPAVTQWKKRIWKCAAAGFACVIIAPVCIWFALAAFSAQIPVGNYSYLLPAEGVLLNSRNELRLAPQLDASIIVHDHMTFYNLQPALNAIISNMRLHDQVHDQRIHSVVFAPPNTVRARGGALLSAGPLTAVMDARVEARLSLLNEYTIEMPLRIDIDVVNISLRLLESSIQKRINAENWSLEFDLREETGIRSLRIHALQLEKSGGATHTITLAFRAGIADLLGWVFRAVFFG